MTDSWDTSTYKEDRWRDLPPTNKQLRLIREKYKEMGRGFKVPRTRGEAAVMLDKLLQKEDG